ncbi:MAG: TauD/TfdA family dioxygenase [Pseudomonadota bacterium]
MGRISVPVIQSNGDEDLVEIFGANAERFKALYQETGVVLFRNFKKSHYSFMNEICPIIFTETMNQTGRHTAREKREGAVHTSTAKNKNAVIVQHSESAYLPSFPSSLLFHCVTAARVGGRTPISSLEYLTQQIPEAIKAKVSEEGVRYVRRMGTVPGHEWQTVYRTDDADALTQKLLSEDTEVEWEGDVLITTRQLPGFIKSVGTSASFWFNALYSSNALTIPQAQLDFLIANFGADKLPNTTYYGSGEALPQHDFVQIERAYRQSTAAFDWQDGDLLWLDNLRYAHGREAFDGDREVLVILGDPKNWADLV